MNRKQASYLHGVRKGSELGDWIHRLPITARVADTIFVHGGIPSSLLKSGELTAASLPFLNGERASLRSDEELEWAMNLLEVRLHFHSHSHSHLRMVPAHPEVMKKRAMIRV